MRNANAVRGGYPYFCGLRYVICLVASVVLKANTALNQSELVANMNIRTQSNSEPAAGAAVLDCFPAEPPRAKVRPPLRTQIWQCAIVAVIALASYVFIRHFLLRSVQIVGVSMAPTLHNTDRYLLNLCVFRVREPQAREIVVIRDPLDQSYSVKRIIACEGDAVCLKGGHVYVNGRELSEPYLSPGVGTFAPIRQEELSWRCGKGEYFLLGDNRDNSADSRVYGTVPRQNILGAIVR